jgi:hypothetical protein
VGVARGGRDICRQNGWTSVAFARTSAGQTDACMPNIGSNSTVILYLRTTSTDLAYGRNVASFADVIRGGCC